MMMPNTKEIWQKRWRVAWLGRDKCKAGWKTGDKEEMENLINMSNHIKVESCAVEAGWRAEW